MKKIPTSSMELIDQLIKDEENLEPNPSMDDRMIMYKAGRWSILNELKLRKEHFNTLTQEILKHKGD